MSVTIDDVRRVAHLARIKMEDSDLEKFQDSLNSILHFIEQLDQVDCSTVDDTVQYTSSLHERQDEVRECDPKVMDNATQVSCNMFVVPKML